MPCKYFCAFNSFIYIVEKIKALDYLSITLWEAAITHQFYLDLYNQPSSCA